MLPVSETIRAARSEGSSGRGAGHLGPRARPGESIRYGGGDSAPVVVWNVTNSCNMACPHCYSAAKRVSPDDLDFDACVRILDRLEEAGVRVVIFSGGEPLLREDLLPLVKIASARGMFCCLSSNGALLTRVRAQEIAEAGVGYVGVSLDGTPVFNDAYRKMEGGFYAALQGIENAKAAGMKTGIRLTLSAPNRDYVSPLLDLAVERGVPRFYLSHLVYGGRGVGFAKNDISHEVRRVVVRELFERAVDLVEQGSATDIVTGGNDADGPALLLFIRERFGQEAAARAETMLLRRGGNSAGEKVINVDHTGRVHPDQFWRTAELGRLPEHSLAEILNSDLAIQLRRREQLLTGSCAGCRFRPICRGSHRERSLAVTGELWGPDPSCYLTTAEVAA